MGTVGTVTDEDISRAANHGAVLARDFNVLIKRHRGIRFLFATKVVDIASNIPASLSSAYIDGIKQWTPEAARDLFRETEENPDKQWFKAGSLGSVWFDIHLNGAGKKKLTRVCLYPGEEEGRFRILLDPTFDEEW